jgi:hypothetical protein
MISIAQDIVLRNYCPHCNFSIQSQNRNPANHSPRPSLPYPDPLRLLWMRPYSQLWTRAANGVAAPAGGPVGGASPRAVRGGGTWPLWAVAQAVAQGEDAHGGAGNDARREGRVGRAAWAVAGGVRAQRCRRWRVKGRRGQVSRARAVARPPRKAARVVARAPLRRSCMVYGGALRSTMSVWGSEAALSTAAGEPLPASARARQPCGALHGDAHGAHRIPMHRWNRSTPPTWYQIFSFAMSRVKTSFLSSSLFIQLFATSSKYLRGNVINRDGNYGSAIVRQRKHDWTCLGGGGILSTMNIVLSLSENIKYTSI